MKLDRKVYLLSLSRRGYYLILTLMRGTYIYTKMYIWLWLFSTQNLVCNELVYMYFANLDVYWF